LHDSILLVQNHYNMPFAIELYSLHSGHILAKLASIGRGPGEFLACSYSGHSVDQSKVYFKDNQIGIYYVVDFLKTLESGKIVVNYQFPYHADISSELILLDDRYFTGYNGWYVDYKQYNNNVPKFRKYEMEPVSPPIYPDDPLMGHSYWVRNVNGARLVQNPYNKQIWLFDQRRDRIEIYDDDLHLIKTITGPDHFNIQYEVYTADGFQGIIFAQGKNFQSYLGYACNDKHIYVIYVGTDSLDYEHYPPVEVFKLDWEGNLLCNYKLDRYIDKISIDSQEEFLYGSAQNTAMDMPQLVRYKL